MVNCTGVAAVEVESQSVTFKQGWGFAQQCNESSENKRSCMSQTDYSENDNMRVKESVIWKPSDTKA